MHENDLLYTIAKEHLIRASGLLSLLMPMTSGVGVGVKGLDGRYLLVNKAMEALFGQTAEPITHLTDKDLFPSEVAARLHLSDQQIIDGLAAASDELDLSAKGGCKRCLWLKFPMMGPDGEILSIGSVMLDISRQEEVADMRQALHGLQKSNQDMQNTLAELDRLASTDKLTGAWNRRRLEETVINEMDRLKRYDHPLSLLIIDIDFFKKINDQQGHFAGDQVLAQLAAVIHSTLRVTDSLTRWGGEEFVVLGPNTTLSTMAMLAERLRERIAQAVFPAVKQMTVSIGVAECMAGESWEEWFKRADAALYRAKACGRNQVQLAPETPRRIGVGENVSANFVQLSWHSAYECGNPLIDSQHRALFEYANDLLAALLSGRPAEEVTALIDALMGAVVQHFKDEEALITAAGFPGWATHAAIHGELVDRAVVLVDLFHAGNLAIGELFQFLAHDVIARHMLGADREFFPYLQKRR
jgi:diguanylate cyclase (GGDEF)-like protein/hemerythrin-like metal-binding protein/PAS domain S-box-containing protein